MSPRAGPEDSKNAANAVASNGIALRLAALAVTPPAGGNETLAQSYGRIAAAVGRELNEAGEERDVQRQTAAQARSVRDQVSGVSLDEEAMELVRFQRAYQAAARMIAVLSDLTETAVNLAR